MFCRSVSIAAGIIVGAMASTAVLAQGTVKVGLVLPLTGTLAAVGTKVEKVNGQLYAVPFATYAAVKDPLKMKK